MAINKKLIHFKTKQKFEEELAKGNILNTSIVFILDTTEIYTHGLLYDGSTFDSSNIEASILNILDNKLDNISDLDTIRSGAALGTTSVQPDDIFDMETKANSSYLYQLKGDYTTTIELNNSLNSAKTYTDEAIANLVGSSSDNINAINLLSSALQSNADIVSLLNNSVTNKADKSLIYNNIQTQTWAAIEDITFPYNYSCNIALENVTVNDYAEVIFSMIDAISGNYAPICETYDGGITIYSKTADIIIIPTIIIYKNN